MSLKKVFLYAEIQVGIPFTDIDWRAINVAMKKNRGLKSKTWLSGLNNHSIGGFYEFDSVANARSYAEGYLADAAKQLGGTVEARFEIFGGARAAVRGQAVREALKGLLDLASREG